MIETVTLFEAHQMYGVSLLQLRKAVRAGVVKWEWVAGKRGRALIKASLTDYLSKLTLTLLGDTWVDYEYLWATYGIKRGWLDLKIREGAVKICQAGVDKGRYSLGDALRTLDRDPTQTVDRASWSMARMHGRP